MAGILEDFTDWRFLNYLARVHDRNSVRHPRYDAEVVAYEEYARVHPVLEIHDKVEDCRLCGHIKAGSRLVHNQQARIAGERHRYNHALLLTATQLVRIASSHALRVCQTDALEKLDDALLRSLGVQVEMVLEDLLYLRADPHGGA